MNKRPYSICFFAAVLLFSVYSYSEGGEDKDSDFNDEFFGEVVTEGERQHDLPQESKGEYFNFSGSITQQLNYSFRDQRGDFPFSRDEKGLSSARLTATLKAEGVLAEKFRYLIETLAYYDFYYHRNLDSSVSDEEFENLADKAEVREAYIEFEVVDDWWFRFGDQIVAVGESDFTQILDVANPRDETDLGLVELELSRLPLLMSRLSYVGQRWGSDLVLIHEFEPNRWAGEGADLDIFISLRDTIALEDALEPDVGLKDPGILTKLYFSLPWGDLSFVYGDVYEYVPKMRLKSLSPPSLDLVFNKVETLGTSFNWIAGSWLFKSEVAYKSKKQIARSDWQEQIQTYGLNANIYLEKPQLLLFGGLEYSGFENVQMSIEVVNETIFRYEPILSQRENQANIAGLLNFQLFRQVAELEIVWARWLEDASEFGRISYSHSLTDAVKVSSGFALYGGQKQDSLLAPYENADKFFASLKYSF